VKVPIFRFTLIDNWAEGSPRVDYVRMGDTLSRFQWRAECKTCGQILYPQSVFEMGEQLTRHTCGSARLAELNT